MSLNKLSNNLCIVSISYERPARRQRRKLPIENQSKFAFVHCNVFAFVFEKMHVGAAAASKHHVIYIKDCSLDVPPSRSPGLVKSFRHSVLSVPFSHSTQEPVQLILKALGRFGRT